MNGEVPHSPGNPGMLEETLHQMNILIQENRDLKGRCERVPGRSAVCSFCAGRFAFVQIQRVSFLRRVAASDQPDDEGAL